MTVMPDGEFVPGNVDVLLDVLAGGLNQHRPRVSGASADRRVVSGIVLVIKNGLR